MQRYHAAGSTNAANNSALGGASTRDASRVDSSSLSSNFSINSRRLAPLAAYKLKCEKEPLNSRLGPPDFHPQSPNCPEENLTREYVQSGYRETVEGLEETREISLTQVQTFNKPAVIKCKESIRKCLRAINESRAQKRKAGQVYGVPLSGSLLTKHGVFPEQKPCSEDSKKKWIEGLSQPHKRLRYLADHVPHGYRRKALFEVLVKNNVPLLRATWFIKVSYLNQVRPNSSTGASSTQDRTQLSRTELWTKDVIEFLQHLLDEFSTRTSSHSVPHNRDRSQMLYAGSMQQKNDPSLVSVDGDEPSLNFKWWYVVRLLHWHHSEGLLLPSLVIDWLLAHLQEKDLLEILQLFLPIIYGFLEAIVLSQTYVRTLATVAVRFIRETSPGGSDLVDNSRRAYTTSALAEMLRYLILAVPDTFVALDCFPLPPSVLSYAASDGTFVSKSLEDARRVKDGSTEVGSVFKSRAIDSQYQTLSFGQVVSSIQKRADNLARAVSPGYPCHNVAKAVQALDKALFHGDVRGAYSYLFEQFCDEVVDEGWIEEVSPSLRSSLKRLRTVNLSFVCSVFFLCEWATSEYRDFRTSRPNDLKLTGKEDIAQVYIACRLLNLKIRDMQGVSRMKIGKYSGGNKFTKGPYQHNGVNSLGYGYESKNSSRTMNGKPSSSSDLFESPGPLHDVIVCWIDQHEADKGKGLKRLQLLIVELMRAGIFHPHAYVRQLIISGIMDSTLNVGDLERKKRHYQMLKQLPGSFIGDVLEEGKLVEGSHILETMRIYSNERRLLLQGILCGSFQNSVKSSKEHEKKNRIAPAKDDALSDHWKTMKSLSSNSILKRMKTEAKVEKLKASIALLLQFPKCSTSSDSGPGESTISAKRSFESVSSKLDVLEGTPGCEECKRAKRQKLGEETSSATQGLSPVSDDEDTWWMRKMPKTSDPSKVDPPIKSSKQAPKSRQKVVRKTQSLAQLAAARIENSQGASTSHVCDSKISCPHHRTAIDGENLKTVDGTRAGGDIISVGKALKQLRLVEKRMITVWLKTMVIQLVENTEKIASKANQYNMPFVPDDDRNSTRWKLGEDELSVILYLMDVCNDLVSAAKFLLWLLPKVQSHPSSTIHSGRSVMMLQRNMESHACEVGEPFWLSSLRRYENMMIAIDIIPDVLSAIMQRLATLLASNVRISGSTTLVYSRYLLKRYGNVPSIAEWEKSRKPTYDKRLISELDSGRSPDGEFGFPLGVPAGVDDPDDFLRQKISGNRISRVGIGMRDVVQRHIDDTLHCFLGKERKFFGASALKGPVPEKLDDGYHVAHQIVMGLMECMRQTGGAAQEGDPSLVSSAVSAIVNNIGPAIVKIPDVHPGNISVASSTSSLTFAQRVLHIHISCLRLLKEALGERQSRVFEIALATEACSALAAAFSPGKASRGQYQMSPDAHDSSANISNESNSAKGLLGKGTKSAAAVSALIIGTVIYGVTNLERLVTVFRLKEGLDVIQFVRSTKTNSNGNARAMGALKVDNLLEVYVHWFRVLVGNCRTVSDGFIVELLGEPSIVALSRMQRILPLSLVLPPAYSIFALVLWRPFILSSNLANREDIHLLYQSLTMAIGDAIKHLPFRDVCLRDSQGFYDLVTADACDADFAAMLDLNGLDMHVKSMAFVPLRGRLFLNSVIDGKLPNSLYTQDDGKRTSLLGGSKLPHLENEMKLMDKLVKVLDALQPAKFHWQWVELRLLLNEQALTEKLETRDMSLADAIRSSSPGPEKGAASENENKFIELILTRLLVRPDAAPLFSELVHLFGRSLEDSMLLHVKWFLGGQDVLFGRKTIRQRLVNIAESKGLSTKAQFWKPWGWSSSRSDLASNRGDKKFEVTSIEEGEVVDDGTDTKKSGKGSIHNSDLESFNVSQHHVTEKALIELVLPCIDQGSEESRNTFASDLIKQLNNIELQINAVTRGANKQAGTASPGLEGPGNKVSNRKGMRGGSPGLARRTSAALDSALPSPAALRTSMSLRLQLLLRLLPTICIDGEPSGRNMKHMLATVILRLLGSRVVYENSEVSIRVQNAQPKRESECLALEAATANLSGESLFDRLLLVLHGLVSNCKPSWLKSRLPSKVGSESIKDSTGFDRELVEGLQSDLDRMQLPSAIRWRIQAAMPILLPSVRCSVSCQPPSVPIAAVAALQPAVSSSSGNPPPQRNSSSITRSSNTLPGKSKQAPPVPVQQDSDIEIDPWLLLEDGTGSGPSSVNTAVVGSSDQSNLRASNLLKGAVRIRRTDLTYIGAVDDDS